MTVQTGQTYRDLDPRMAGRTLKVVDASLAHGDKVLLEVLTNPSDVQALLDDDTPGTRSYTPKDRRGATTKISRRRLEDGKSFGLVEDAPEISGPL